MRHNNKTSRATVLFNIRFISSRIFENVTPNKPFASNSFYRPTTISRGVILKTKNATIAFSLVTSFLPPRSFFSSFPFRLLVWFWSLSGPKSLPFDAFSLQWLQISLGWFSKSRLGIIFMQSEANVYPLNTRVRRNCAFRFPGWIS